MRLSILLLFLISAFCAFGQVEYNFEELHVINQTSSEVDLGEFGTLPTGSEGDIDLIGFGYPLYIILNSDALVEELDNGSIRIEDADQNEVTIFTFKQMITASSQNTYNISVNSGEINDNEDGISANAATAQSANQKADANLTTINSNIQRIATLEPTVSSMNANLNGLLSWRTSAQNELNNLNTRQSSIEGRVDVAESDLIELSDQLESIKVDTKVSEWIQRDYTVRATYTQFPYENPPVINDEGYLSGVVGVSYYFYRPMNYAVYVGNELKTEFTAYMGASMPFRVTGNAGEIVTVYLKSATFSTFRTPEMNVSLITY